MADQNQAHTNGPADGQKYIDTIDPEDPEYIRQMRRPAEVKEDVKQMEQRKRVSMIMRSQAFREELEQIVNEQLSSGSHPASLLALQQISDLVLPSYRFNQTGGFSKVSSTVIPIADIRGVDSLNYSKGEKILRCKTASAYRLVDMYGWSSGINNLISVRISQDYEHFLVAPFGLLHHEVTAASLCKVDMRGDIVDAGTTILPVNKQTFALHAAVHAARPDIKAIIHLQNTAANAVSSMKCGLLPISQESVLVGECSYYEYQGTVQDQEEKDKIARTLGPNNKVLFLTNCGVLACGESVEEAYYYANNIMAACDTQLRAAPAGLDNLAVASDETRRRMYEAAQIGGGGDAQEGGKKRWRKGEVEFEALMRHLDNCGFRTGYVYHEPNIRREQQRRDRANADVEVPPTTSSFAYFFDDDKFSSPLKAQYEYQKKQSRTEWLNTPNNYRKEEFEETGTPNPKKVTKWVPEKDQQGTPLKITNPNQFAPQGADPRELVKKHKDIRKDYYEERITAGPQSRILEGMTWDEAQKIKDGHVSGTADSMIVVGAASKGIILKDHQTNVGSYRQYYTPNPFDSMSEEEIERYKREVEKRSGSREITSEEELEPAPDGKLISTQERMQQVRQADSVEVQVLPARQYIDARVEMVQRAKRAYDAPRETNIDDVMDQTNGKGYAKKKRTKPRKSSRQDSTEGGPPSPKTPTTPQGPQTPVAQGPQTPPAQDFQRTQSARFPEAPVKSPALVGELQQNFERSKSERKPKKKKASQVSNGEEQQQAAMQSPTKSTSSGDATLEEGSPTKEAPSGSESPEKKGKKKKFRIPSFSKKKEKEKK